MKMLDALIIAPCDQKQIYQGLSSSLTAIEPPVWARLIGSYLRGLRYSVDILDAEADGLNFTGVADMAQYLKPRLIILSVHGQQPSASTQLMPAAIVTCRAIKSVTPDIPILVTGGHPAALPERTLEETGADFVCTGEGPVTASAVLRLAINPLHWRSNLPDVPGICYSGGVTTHYYATTQPALNVINLDAEMPGGCWDLLPMDRYRAHNHHCLDGSPREPYASIYTSLNCPFACSFCMIASPFRAGDKLRSGGKPVNFYRTWSGETVIREIEMLVEKYGVTTIRVNDEMFVLNQEHVFDICDRIIERYEDKLNLWCYGRVDCTHEKFLDKMRRAGFKWICLGIEAASSDVRDGVEKAGYGAEDIIETCKRIKDHDINILGNFMVGLPSDTRESMRQTLDLAIEVMPEFFNIYPMMIYPGSALWDALPEEKRSYDWRAYSHHSYDSTPAGNENLTPAEVLAFRDMAFIEFFTNQSYLDYVGKRFGETAVERIKAMTTVRLKRKILGE